MKINLRKVTLLLAVATMSFSTLKAQSLLSKINSNASVVMLLKGNNFFGKVSEAEFENSSLFNELSYELFRGKAMAKPSMFADMGIKTNGELIYAIEKTEDIIYYYTAYEISDLIAYEKFIKAGEDDKNITKEGGINIINYDYDSKLVWNNKMAVFLTTKYIGEEYQTSNYWYYDWNYSEDEKTIEEIEAEINDLKKDLKINYNYDDIEVKIDNEDTYEYDNIYDEVAEAVDAAETTVTEGDYYSEENIKERKKNEEKNEKIRTLDKLKKKLIKKKKIIAKEKFVKKEMSKRVNEFYRTEQPKSFTSKGFDISAIASIWSNTSNVSDLMFPNIYGYNRNRYNPMAGFEDYMSGDMVANLYLKDDKIQMKAKMSYSGELKESMKKIYNSKIDSKFLKYISNDVLAYSSLSMNSQNFYEEVANISKNFFANSEEEYGEAISVYIDFLSIVIDEEAIGELITGDALFILNDLSTQTVEYKTYEYDENFNSTAIAKTKEELMPEFTVMIGSNNPDMINKLIKLGKKHDMITEKNSYYIIADNINELPFKLYVANKDGIVFLTNSAKQLADILNGKVDNKIKGEHKKRIKSNAGTAYFNMGKTTEKVLLDEEMAKELSFLFEVKEDLKEFYYTASMENGDFEIDTYFTVPEGSKNSAHYLLQFISKAIDFDKR